MAKKQLRRDAKKFGDGNVGRKKLWLTASKQGSSKVEHAQNQTVDWTIEASASVLPPASRCASRFWSWPNAVTQAFPIIGVEPRTARARSATDYVSALVSS